MKRKQGHSSTNTIYMRKYQAQLSQILRLEGLAVFPALRLAEIAKTNLRLNFKAGFTVTMFEFNVFMLLFLKFR